MENYAIYLRKSRGDPEDETIEETLAKHRETLLDYSEKMKLKISGDYSEVVSGDGLFIRPQMVRLISDIEQGSYSGVICMDIDRLGRVDTKDRGIILETFKEHNVKIVTPSKTYDLNDEFDEFSTEMQMLFARQELKKITKRLRGGIMKTVEDGYHVGEPPYGYRRIYKNKKPTLEFSEPEATVVKMIFDMYTNQHLGTPSIAELINSLGYLTRKNSPFSRNTIRFILSNPIYISKIVYNKTHRLKKKLLTDKFRSLQNPASEWIISDGIHPPIIDDKTFETAQKIRSTRSHPPANTGKIENPFAGICFCANCGKLMRRQSDKRKGSRILCDTTNCNKSISLDIFENTIICIIRQEISSWISHDKTLGTLQTMPNKQLAELKKQLTVLENQKSILYDLFEQGVYTLDIFNDRFDNLSKRIAKINQQIIDTKKHSDAAKRKIDNNKEFYISKFLSENYKFMTAFEKNLFYKMIVKKIIYRREKENKSDFYAEIYFHDWL